MRVFRTTGILFVAALGLSGCMTLEPGGANINLLSPAQERELGARVAAEVEKQERVLEDPGLQAYVTGIGNRLAAVAERQDVAYEFKVIDNPGTVNAFALPGGRMYVYTGLMKLCEDEAELASVMAHEIAHVSSYHHGEAMTRAYGYEMLASLLLGKNPGQAGQLAAGLIGQSGTMFFSRQNERESDAKGMNYLARAGYNPESMVGFMEKMLSTEASQGPSRRFALFSSHPATLERVATLQAQVQQYPAALRESSTFPERYQAQVLQKLNR